MTRVRISRLSSLLGPDELDTLKSLVQDQPDFDEWFIYSFDRLAEFIPRVKFQEFKSLDNKIFQIGFGLNNPEVWFNRVQFGIVVKQLWVLSEIWNSNLRSINLDHEKWTNLCNLIIKCAGQKPKCRDAVHSFIINFKMLESSQDAQIFKKKMATNKLKEEIRALIATNRSMMAELIEIFKLAYDEEVVRNVVES